MRNPLTTAALFVSLAATPTLAQFDTGDVAINLDGDRVLVGQYDAGAAFQLVEDCVFLADMGAALSTADPGFDSPTGAFPTGASAGIDILRAVQRWDGGAFVPTTTRLGVGFGPLTENLSPTDNTPSLGAGWASVSGNGELHQHWAFTLVSPEEPGVYLAELRLFVGGAESDPFWMLFASQSDALTIEAAELFVRANLSACEPGSPADMTTSNTNPGEPGFGEPDGVIDGADLSFYVERWITADASRADINTTNTNPGQPGYGSPDGTVDGADLSFYVEAWLAGLN